MLIAASKEDYDVRELERVLHLLRRPFRADPPRKRWKDRFAADKMAVPARKVDDTAFPPMQPCDS